MTIKCPVCGKENTYLLLRCASCKSYIQPNLKALDLFATLFSLWRNPELTLKRIVIADHRNYTLLLALLEALGLSFFFFYFIKAADVFSLSLSRVLMESFDLSLVVFLPTVYLFSALNYVVSRIRGTGARFRGIVSGTVYALHPLALGAVILFPVEVAIFGVYIFSNNPPPQVINPAAFYSMAFLGIVCCVTVVFYYVRFSRMLFGVGVFVFAFVATAIVSLFSSFEIAKMILLAH